MENLPGMELYMPEFSVIDIKYDGPSFEGVMDISDLGNELLGLEYCLKGIFKQLKSLDNKLAGLTEENLIILVEPFQNNCFRKKIRIFIKDIRTGINGLTNKEIAVLVVTIPCILGGTYTVIKDLIPNEVQQITEQNISPELLNKIQDKNIAQLLSDPRFRKEVSRIATPLLDSNDIGEIRTQDIEGKENLVVINQASKNNFFAIGGFEKTIKVDELYMEKSETLYGRINAIDVDAPKRQLGFKINGDGKEIDCSFSGSLKVEDYIKLVGKWIIIEGSVTYRGINPEKIEIIKIIEAEPPFREAKNMSFSF